MYRKSNYLYIVVVICIDFGVFFTELFFLFSLRHSAGDGFSRDERSIVFAFSAVHEKRRTNKQKGFNKS